MDITPDDWTIAALGAALDARLEPDPIFEAFSQGIEGRALDEATMAAIDAKEALALIQLATTGATPFTDQPPSGTASRWATKLRRAIVHIGRGIWNGGNLQKQSTISKG